MPYKKEVINPVSGQRLREELKVKGLTHAAFADIVNLDPKVIGFLCQGKRRITEYRAEEFSKVLGVRAEYLLGLDDYRVRDTQWLNDTVKGGVKALDLLEKGLSFWGYKIESVDPVYEYDEEGVREIVGGTWIIRKPSGEIVEVDEDKITQIKKEILEFMNFKFQSL